MDKSLGTWPHFMYRTPSRKKESVKALTALTCSAGVLLKSTFGDDTHIPHWWSYTHRFGDDDTHIPVTIIHTSLWWWYTHLCDDDTHILHWWGHTHRFGGNDTHIPRRGSYTHRFGDNDTHIPVTMIHTSLWWWYTHPCDDDTHILLWCWYTHRFGDATHIPHWWWYTHHFGDDTHIPRWWWYRHPCGDDRDIHVDGDTHIARSSRLRTLHSATHCNTLQ